MDHAPHKGASLFPVMPDGSSVKFLDPEFLPRIAIISPPTCAPYFLLIGGGIEEFDPHDY